MLQQSFVHFVMLTIDAEMKRRKQEIGEEKNGIVANFQGLAETSSKYFAWGEPFDPERHYFAETDLIDQLSQAFLHCKTIKLFGPPGSGKHTALKATAQEFEHVYYIDMAEYKENEDMWTFFHQQLFQQNRSRFPLPQRQPVDSFSFENVILLTAEKTTTHLVFENAEGFSKLPPDKRNHFFGVHNYLREGCYNNAYDRGTRKLGACIFVGGMDVEEICSVKHIDGHYSKDLIAQNVGGSGFGEIKLKELNAMLSDWYYDHKELDLKSSPREYAESIHAQCSGQIPLTGFCCFLLNQEAAKNPPILAEEFSCFLKDNLSELVMQQPAFTSKLQEIDKRPKEAAILTKIIEFGSVIYQPSWWDSGHDWLLARGFARTYSVQGLYSKRIGSAAPILEEILLKHKSWIKPDSWLTPATP